MQILPVNALKYFSIHNTQLIFLTIKEEKILNPLQTIIVVTQIATEPRNSFKHDQDAV